MSTHALLAELTTAGVHIEARGERLHVEAPAGAMTEELARRLRQQKPDLLRLLTPTTDEHGPTEFCSLCGCGNYHQTERDGPWLCSACHPRTGTSTATLTIPGGRIPSGARHNVDAVIAEAVSGLPITGAEFRVWCDPDDLADIAAGLIPVATVRAYAQELVRQGPRELGTTVGGVRVCTYREVHP